MESCFPSLVLNSHSQWYPPIPDQMPIDSFGSFDEGVPYIYVIRKTHLVFRLIYPFIVEESIFYLNTPVPPGESYPIVKGIDILVEHNFNFNSQIIFEKIQDSLLAFTSLHVKEVQNLIISYYNLDHILVKILYPVMLKEVQIQNELYRRRAEQETHEPGRLHLFDERLRRGLLKDRDKKSSQNVNGTFRFPQKTESFQTCAQDAQLLCIDGSIQSRESSKVIPPEIHCFGDERRILDKVFHPNPLLSGKVIYDQTKDPDYEIIKPIVDEEIKKLERLSGNKSGLGFLDGIRNFLGNWCSRFF